MTTRRAEDQGDAGARPGWLWLGLLAVTGSSGLVLAILARRLPPAGFAACATVLTLGLVLGVLPGALQLRAAAAAADGRAAPLPPRSLLLAVGVIVLIGAPILRIPVAAGVALALLVNPLCKVALRRGAYLGVSDFRAVGRSLAIEATGRVTLGAIAGLLWGPTGVALALLTAVSLAAFCTPERAASGPRAGLERLGGLTDTALSLGLLALVAHLDVLLAPLALGHRAGAFDLAALPAKVIVVGLAAAGLAAFPRARRSAAQQAALTPLTITLAAGAVLAAGLVIGSPALVWVFGKQQPDPVLLALLGTAMAMAAATSVGVHVAIARGGRRPWAGLLVAVAIEVAAAVLHLRPVPFAGAVMLAQAVTLAAVVARLVAVPPARHAPRPTSLLRQRSARRTPAVSIVIPALNEERRLPSTLFALTDALDPATTELIVVDDGSTDATANVASVLLAPLPNALVLRLAANRGKGAAVRAGVARARGDAVVFMDADLSTALEDLPALLAALDDAHVAVGSRSAPGARAVGAPVTRVGMGRTFNHLVRAVTPLSMTDTQCGFKAFRAPTAKLLFHLGHLDGFAFDVEVLTLAHRIGYPVAEVPVQWTHVPGSHVRPVADSLTMAADLVRTSWRWQPNRVVAAIEAIGRGAVDVDRAVDLVRGQIGRAGPVVPWGDRALVLLPFVEAIRAEQVALRLRHRLPDLRVSAGAVSVTELFARSSVSLRAALIGA